MDKFACKEEGCSALFAYESSLVRHHRIIHEGRQLSCPFEKCTKIFVDYGALKRHQDSIHGGRLYPCPEAGCGATYTTEGGLWAHKKKVHKKRKLSQALAAAKKIENERNVASMNLFPVVTPVGNDLDSGIVMPEDAANVHKIGIITNRGNSALDALSKDGREDYLEMFDGINLQFEVEGIPVDTPESDIIALIHEHPEVIMLALRNCENVGDATLEAIGRCNFLDVLDIRGCFEITILGLNEVVAKCEMLTTLSVSLSNFVTQEGIAALKEIRPGLKVVIEE